MEFGDHTQWDELGGDTDSKITQIENEENKTDKRYEENDRCIDRQNEMLTFSSECSVVVIVSTIKISESSSNYGRDCCVYSRSWEKYESFTSPASYRLNSNVDLAL